jgi:hypothetical protein
MFKGDNNSVDSKVPYQYVEQSMDKVKDEDKNLKEAK